MGYTHYWERAYELPQQQFYRWGEDVRAIIAHANVPVAREYDEPNLPPETSPDLVRFNGVGDEGHETFYVKRIDRKGRPGIDPPSRVFAFCKTAMKPYDLVVCAALIRLKHHCDEYVSVDSDGHPEDWEEARKLCEALFGYATIPPGV